MSREQESFERYRRGYRRIHMDFHNPEFVDDIGHRSGRLPDMRRLLAEHSLAAGRASDHASSSLSLSYLEFGH